MSDPKPDKEFRRIEYSMRSFECSVGSFKITYDPSNDLLFIETQEAVYEISDPDHIADIADMLKGAER